MANQPSVDVIIPTYNNAHFISDAVNSVLNQTFRPQQIIVVDDGSTDGTAGVLAPFMDKITYIKHPENRGLPAARNTGIRAGQSELIAFLDSDDVWLPDKLEQQVPEFHGKERLGLCYTGILKCNAQLRPLPRQRKFHRRDCEDVFNELFCLWFAMPVSTVIIRRGVVQECGEFDETVRKIEDWEYWLRIAMRYSISCIPAALSYIRVHSQSITNTYGIGEQLRYAFMVIERCALTAHTWNITLPMSVEQRKSLLIRRHLKESIEWKDRNAAHFYASELEKRGEFSRWDRMSCAAATCRTAVRSVIVRICRALRILPKRR